MILALRDALAWLLLGALLLLGAVACGSLVSWAWAHDPCVVDDLDGPRICHFTNGSN